MMKALVIGLGSIGRRHVHNVQSLSKDTQFIFLRQRKTNHVDIPLNPHVVHDIQDAIALHPDIAVIATPSSLHMKVMPSLFQAKIPVYIEKPIVTTKEDVTLLQQWVKTGDALPPMMIGCNLRFLPSLIQLRSMLLQEKMGTIVRASLQAGQWLPDWRPDQVYQKNYSARNELGGGVIFDFIHEIDMARWLFGEFDLVRALGGKFSTLDIATEDTACIVLGNKGRGPVVSISLDYVSRQPIRCYEVVGEKGTVRWDLSKQSLEFVTADGCEVIHCGSDGFNVDQTYVMAMAEFLDCAKQRKPTSIDLSDGLKSLELALKAKAEAL